MNEVIEYHPRKGIAELDGTQPLTELVNQEFVITSIEFYMASVGEVAKVIVDGKGAYRTTSEVLMKQLRDIKANILGKNPNAKVKVKLIKHTHKRYYTFA
ncbi:MAG: hypothetical protein ACUVTB_06810 [Candidatus Bathycorpusculaceae bacterium]